MSQSALMVSAVQAQNESKIIAGTAVDISKIPYMAALEQRDNAKSNFLQQCGSIIIDKQYIISAGHCFLNIDGLKITRPAASDFRIRVASSQLEKGGTVYSVAQYWVHPKFKITLDAANSTSLDYDIGVARLATPIVFGTSVGKATLIGLNQKLATNTRVIAAGWGVTTYTGPESTVLRQGTYNVVQQPACNQKYYQQNKASVTPRFFCTYSASQGPCFGDSGGPVYNPTGNVVAGIISWGTCYVLPNVVTDLGNAEIRSYIRETSKLNV